MAKILVVDDSPLIRRNLKNALENSGHTVVAELSDGKDVLNFYDSYLPDLVTLDISMPEVDGLTALKNLLSTHAEAKVVVISALTQKEKILESLEIGAKSFIVKPFEKDKVIEVINFVLNESLK